MNAVRMMLAACTIVASGVCKPETTGDRWDSIRSQVVEMRESLAADGALAFVSSAFTPRVAPHIHSQCWVDWLPKAEVDRRKCEQEMRDFGLDMVGQLERYALDIEPHGDLLALERSAEELLTIAEWLKTSSGYGNYILKRWAENLALIRLCLCTVNPRCNLHVIQKMYNRIDGTSRNLELRVAILNEESPHTYSLPFIKTEESASMSLCSQWAWYMRESVAYYKGNSGGLVRAPRGFSDVKGDKPEYAFYVEDTPGGMYTLRDIWPLKWHYQLCAGAMDMSLHRQLSSLLKYREVVGEIPLPPEANGVMLDPFGMSKATLDYIDSVSYRWNAVSKETEPSGVARSVMRLIQGDCADYMTANCRLVHNRR